jgi:predicted transporter
MQYLVLKEQQLKMLKKKQPRGVLNMKLLLMRYYFLNSLLFLNKYIKIKLFSLVKLK